MNTTALLSPVLTIVAVSVIVGVFLAVGIGVALGRRTLGAKEKDPTASFVRSWLGLGLNAGLLVGAVASLGLADSTLRSTLFGGLIAGAGAASAFYFASSGSDQARQDILRASRSGSTVPVPELTNLPLSEARDLFARLELVLVTATATPTAAAKVVRSVPGAGELAHSGDTVLVYTD